MTSDKSRNTEETESSGNDGDGSKMADIVGPFYSPECVRKMLGDRMADYNLLAVTASDGQLFYPVFQFDGKEPRQDVLDIVSILLPPSDPWTVGVWLNTPNHVDEPKGRTALQLLDDGEYDAVVRSATETVGPWYW